MIEKNHPFVDEVIVLKEAINDIVSDPETKRRIYNRASELMERRKRRIRKQMNKYDIQDRYCKWWVGKKCRPVGQICEFKRVKTVIYHSSFSGVYGSGEFIYEDGTHGLITCGEAFKPRKRDVEVMDE